MTESVRKSVRNMDHVVDHMQEPLTKYLDRVQTLAGPNCLAMTAGIPWAARLGGREVSEARL